MSPEFKRVFAALKKNGLLLLNDANLPNVCAIVAAERVRGSWWSHPRAQEIFKVYDGLEDHPDVLIIKLVSGKVTYVHRSLWPQVVAAGGARDTWQMRDLTAVAPKLLTALDRAPVEPGLTMGKAASELETRLLFYGMQFHSESGVHIRGLESWDHWAKRIGAAAERVAPSSARSTLEAIVAALNREHSGKGRLPWQTTAR